MTFTDRYGTPLEVGDSVLVGAKITRISEGFAEIAINLEASEYHGWFKLSDLIANGSCIVKSLCLTGEKRGECRKCKAFSKFERKKSKSRQATGRANKRKGKESEKKLLLHFQRQGLEARIIEGSGAYKKSREGADSDLRVNILGKERKVENKKYGSKVSALNRIRKLIGEKGILYITGFCYVMDENVFYDIVKNKIGTAVNSEDKVLAVRCEGQNAYHIKEVSDRDYGWLHKFYEQDYADIVSLDENYRDFLFCLQPDFFGEIVCLRK